MGRHDLILRHMQSSRPDHQSLSSSLLCCQDPNLRHTLQFGIGLHHAGLVEADRDLVESLFVGGRIQVLHVLSRFG